MLESLREGVAESDAPEIANRMDWVFMAGPELEGVSLDELKRWFQSWARADAAHVLDADEPGTSRGSRFDFFVQADEDALRSFEPDSGSTYAALLSGAHVNLVRGWVDPLPEEEAMVSDGDRADHEDWLKIQIGTIGHR